MARDIVLLSKKTVWCQHAADIARSFFAEALTWHAGGAGDALPVADGGLAKGSILVSFLSPWIVPQRLLDQAGVAINFHPGSRHYPGSGCYNFAIFEGAKEFGSVCHHMARSVDTGSIIREDLFPLTGRETIEQLKLRTMVVMLAQFHEIMHTLRAGADLPKAAAGWTRKAFTKRDLNDLARVTPEMTDEEVGRRVRAMAYPGFSGAFVDIGGERFQSPTPPRAIVE
jgi:methionyl-tRNA formyltransferase